MSNASIYTGPWINHSHGVLLGATLTLKLRDAGFLLAVLVVVVGATGRAFCRCWGEPFSRFSLTYDFSEDNVLS